MRMAFDFTNRVTRRSFGWAFSRLPAGVQLGYHYTSAVVLGMATGTVAGITAWTAIGEAHELVRIVVMPVVGFVVCAAVIAARTRRPAGASTHGSAAFANAGLVARAIGSPVLAAYPSALLIGRADVKGAPLLRYIGTSHLCSIMPTRGGKGAGSILPNLLTSQRSIICIDPKGENCRIAARARDGMGRVFALDPFGIGGRPSSSYDPCAGLVPGSPDLAEDAATLADALVYDPPNSGDPHWNESAKALISGLLMHIACRAPGEPGGLPELRRLLTLPADQWFALLETMQASTEAGGLVARAANQQLAKGDREAPGVLSAAVRHSAFLDGNRIAGVSARSDFTFADLRAGICTVFVVLPPDRLTAYARWMRLLVAQSVQELARAPQLPGTVPVLMILDECAAIGRLEPVKQAVALMAGLGLQLWTIWQDMNQLKALYGLDAPTFLANSGVIQVGTPNDLETATWLSKSLGNFTVEFQTVNSGSSQSENRISNSSGNSQQFTGRALATPDELMQMHASTMILLRAGERPALVGKLRHYADAEFAGLWD